MEQTVTGTLVSVAESKYNSFKGRDGSDVPAGSNWYAFIVPSPSSAPVQVKVTREQAGAAQASIGKGIELKCRVFAQGNQLRYSAI